MMKKEAILAKQKDYLWPNHILYYTDPLPLDHGDGLYVWDVDGVQYLDFFAGILTNSVGHNHPHIVESIKHQLGKLVHSSTLYPNETHVTLAEKISSLVPGKLQTSFFTNSGTEANETAVMLAKAYTGEQEIVALRHGYSGRSALGMSLMGHSTWRIGSSEIPGIKHAINPYCYRCPLNLKPDTCGVACAEDVEDVIRTTTSGRIAGFLAEPIQGVGGFITPPDEYFSIVSEIVKHYGGLFICDEVQTGFGRTGHHWFGIDHWNIEPDIMTMAKGIANGMPMGNTVTTVDIASQLVGKGLTISTFGGNPVSCASSLSTIEVLENEANPDHVADVGNALRLGLEKLQERYSFIGDVRGKGLMQGLELVQDRKSKEPAPKVVDMIFEATKERGLLIGKGGLYSNVLRISPPLTANHQHIDEALGILDDAFRLVQRDF
tara:strand:+ start:18479 stop:19783 length:1305 start_codon:yes stop_codon:yes gene_type:complete